MQEKDRTFWSVAALAYAPTAAVMFGVLWVAVAAIGEPVFATPLFQFDTGAVPLFIGIALSFGLAIPIALGVARLMLMPREKRAMDSEAATRLPRDA